MLNSLPVFDLNLRCTGVKRLLKEALELSAFNEFFVAKPMEDNLFEWHFTIRGPPDTAYEKGVYHGRIILPFDYPMKPPSLILLTPNGRFETNKKICLSISGYHPETWLPSWSIRTALLALIGFMPSHSVGAIGSLDCSEQERRKLAIKSLDWRCKICNCIMRDILPTLNKTLLNKELKLIVNNNYNKNQVHSNGKNLPITNQPSCANIHIKRNKNNWSTLFWILILSFIFSILLFRRIYV